MYSRLASCMLRGWDESKTAWHSSSSSSGSVFYSPGGHREGAYVGVYSSVILQSLKRLTATNAKDP